ncbi:hypothetical protein Vi05172_g2960 [Venturia inaequalis]|nr:hypothetical protein Vi05172_g2960 [Venturia inaequalis]
MQFATLLSLSLVAFSLTPTTLACSWNSDTKKSQDCCWGGKSTKHKPYGYAGCYRQHKNSDPCNGDSYKADFCDQHGLTEKDCVSDVVFEMEAGTN